MNYSVVYGSMTKHCQKLASAIANETNSNIFNVKSNTSDLLYCDVAVFVTGVYGGEILREMDQFIKSVNNGQLSKAIIVYSTASGDYSKVKIKDVLESKGIEVVGELSTVGSFIFKNFLRPNKDDIKLAVDFVKEKLAQINM